MGRGPRRSREGELVDKKRTTSCRKRKPRYLLKCAAKARANRWPQSAHAPAPTTTAIAPAQPLTDTMASASTSADGDAPGSSKRLCHGYHPPYTPRRPQRYAKLRASKAISKVPSNDSEEPVSRKVASVLDPLSLPKATPSRRSRDSVEVLMEVAEAMQPQQTKRTARHVDNLLLSEQEVLGARHKYRMSQSSVLVYDNEWDDLISDNMLVSVDFLSELSKCTVFCYKCNNTLEFDEVGFGPVKTMIAKCNNDNCDYDNFLANYPRKKGHFYVTNLSVCYDTLLNDTGYVGFVRSCQAKRLNVISKGSYYNHATSLYKMMKTLYNENISKVHSDIKSFFQRNFKKYPNYNRGEYLDLAVSIDGSYGHMGRYSTFGVTFVCEVITGRLIDFEVTEKCTKCEKSDDFKDNGNCIYQKFHGSSGSMEIHNALVLFKRSTLWGFRYTDYVSDGDSKVFPHLSAANIYPGIDISKMECANHLQKRACAAVHKFGSKWKPGSPPKAPSAKTPRKKTKTALEKAAEKCSSITNFFQPESSAQPSGEPAPCEPSSQPVAEYVPSEPSTEPAVESAVEPTAEPAVEPVPSKASAQPNVRPSAAPPLPTPRARKKRKTKLQLAAETCKNISMFLPPSKPAKQPVPQPESSVHPSAQPAVEPEPPAQPAAQPAPCMQSEPSTEPLRRSCRISAKPAAKPSKNPDSAPAQPGKRGKKATYPLRKMFTWNRCFELSQKYKMAVYQNRVEGPEAQSRAVKAIVYHEQDYPGSSVEERKEFHQFCGIWCKFKLWESQGKPLGDFNRSKKDIHGNDIVWEGGLLAKFKIDYAEAYNELKEVFEELGNHELMSRCSKALTQNINESVHSKLWRHCLKKKKTWDG